MRDFRISVVVPAWNEAERLPRLLDALERCDPPPCEVIVADGGSEDGTAGLAARRATLVRAPRGRASQQNAAAKIASGDALWFVHADSVPAPSALAEILSALDDGARGGCFRIAFPPAERAAHPLMPWIERGINLRTLVTRRGTGDQGLFARADAFRQAGGFPPWPLFEDVALASAIGGSGRFAVCRGPLETSARRWLRHGAARTTALMWALRIAYLAGTPPHRLARIWSAAG
ncbi:MAG TPA: TIGR04283 family arsenosugar biosynthesis glycosyltransferase [Gemmatimonadota bacterium]|nr:TIGR04283 family arsenosugar biosynthesis glycosyltransferase [Gemmatimonadota bacterium]